MGNCLSPFSLHKGDSSGSPTAENPREGAESLKTKQWAGLSVQGLE